MYTIHGRFTDATIFNDHIDQKAVDQLHHIIDQPLADHTHVALMPDGHFGAGVPVGTTIKLLAAPEHQQVAPTIISGDIGCGMLAIELDLKTIDFAKLDQVINHLIPTGANRHASAIDPQFADDLVHQFTMPVDDQLVADVRFTLGTLGGGNHFIELDKAKSGHYYLVVHCGSRHVGTDILNHYLQLAKQQTHARHNAQIEDLMQPQIQQLLQSGRQTQINAFITQFKNEHPIGDDQYATLTGAFLQAYLSDVKVGQRFAQQNRQVILKQIINAMGWGDNVVSEFESVHNYYDHDQQVLRKGATSAAKGKSILIPLNMRDGSLICIGKGNDDWNQSAPHGAGRALSRHEAKAEITMDKFKAEMAGIHSSSINEFTLDEAPDAYKNMQEIVDNIAPTAEIVERIQPVYNFKDHVNTRGVHNQK